MQTPMTNSKPPFSIVIATHDRKYNVSDLDMLIGERQRLGIRSLNELSEYHLRFQAVTSYLLEKKLIGEVEQFNAFVRSFSPAFWKDISRRLQVKYPDHYPDLPYKISEVYEAARFVLHTRVVPTTYMIKSRQLPGQSFESGQGKL
jgi:hypothetical protein